MAAQTAGGNGDRTSMTLYEGDLERLKEVKHVLYGSAGEHVPHREALLDMCDRIAAEGR